jgi:hypothetical protein
MTKSDKQCILTITRSDGHSRSYKCEAVFLRRADAKARVATLAVQLGALDFISEGNTDLVKSDGAPSSSISSLSTDGASDTKQTKGPTSPEVLIENCLLEWRAGKVSAEWIFYNDSKVVSRECILFFFIPKLTFIFRIWCCFKDTTY